MTARRIAPWPDYAGNVIREGDTIVHPSGERGRVEFDDSYIHETGKWRVRYGDNPVEAHSALCLQIGDRGMAVVTSDPPPQPAVLVPADELAALRRDAERWRFARDPDMSLSMEQLFGCGYESDALEAHIDEMRRGIYRAVPLDRARGVK
jgi:hypothetical protein